MTDIVVSPPVEIDPANIDVQPPVSINSINIFQSWSYDHPVVGNTVYLPAIIVNDLSEVPSGLTPGTAILVKTQL